MNRPTGKTLIAAAGILLVITVVASPLFFMPYQQEKYAPVDSSPVQLAAMQRIDLNSACAEQLALLPGIGEKRAQAIIDYRREHGQFTAMAELTNVPGITSEMIRKWQGIAWIKISSDDKV